MDESSPDDRHRGVDWVEVAEFLSRLADEARQQVRRCFDVLARKSKRFKQRHPPQLHLLREYIYRLIATSAVMVFLLSLSLSVGFIAAFVSTHFPNSQWETIAVHGMFLGIAGVAAVGYVYVGRLGFWFRQKLIEYWRTRTLPFPIESDDNRPQSAYEADDLSEKDWHQAKDHIVRHLILGLVFNIVGIWGTVALLEIEPGIGTQTIIQFLRTIGEAVAVLFGGIPALASLMFATPLIPLVDEMGDDILLFLTTASLIPAFPLAVAFRNVTYILEFQFNNIWEEGSYFLKAGMVMMLLGAIVWALEKFLPEVFPLW